MANSLNPRIHISSTLYGALTHVRRPSFLLRRSENLKYYTGYGVEDQEFRDMVKRLHLLHWEAGEKGKASWNKFRTKRWGEVALKVGVNEGELGF